MSPAQAIAPKDTRERIVEATAALFMQQGFAATGLKSIAAAADATTGSLYHFFPGGKGELAAAVLRTSGQAYEDLVCAIFDAAPDLVTGVLDAFEGAAAVLEATDFVDACPIATVALEVVSSHEALRLVTADVFASWLRACTVRAEAAGIPPARAHELAVAIVAAIEGGFLLSRAAKDASAMRALGRSMVVLVEDALA